MSLFMAEVPHASNYTVLGGEILRLIDEPWLIDRGTTSFVGCFVIEIGWIAKGFGGGIAGRVSWLLSRRFVGLGVIL